MFKLLLTNFYIIDVCKRYNIPLHGVYSKDELKKYFEYYKLNSTNFWSDYLKIKTEDIIRPKLEKYKSLYYISRKIKRNFL